MFSKFFVSVEWLGVFAIATMLLFILAIIILLVWVARLDKDQVEEQRNLPLKD